VLQGLTEVLQGVRPVVPQHELPGASPGLPLSALAQRYALHFGDEELSTQFQTLFQKDLPALPLVEELAQRLGPGVHVTLLRVPLLEDALARHQPGLPLYVLQPSRTEERSVITLRHVAGKGWEKLKKPPGTFDPRREALLLRPYRGYLPNRVFGAPLLTEDDYLLHVRKLEETLPPELATPIKSVLARQPSLLLGMSLLSWDHRHLLYSLFARRPLPEGSTVLLEPGHSESESWRRGRGLPGGGGLRLIQASYPGLAEHLGASAPGGAR